MPFVQRAQVFLLKGILGAQSDIESPSKIIFLPSNQRLPWRLIRTVRLNLRLHYIPNGDASLYSLVHRFIF